MGWQPKQLIHVAGKPVIEHTIAAISASPLIDEIVIVAAYDQLDDIRNIVEAGGYSKVRQILAGGATRNESTLRAIDALGDQECNVLIHDAVRPLVSSMIIEACVEALREYEAVDTVIASADTIVEVDQTERTIAGIPPRHLLRRGQTPQGFRLSVLRRAYEHARRDPGFVATDDCSVVLRYEPHVPIAAVPGHESNMKITEPIDLHIVDKLFQLTTASATRPGDHVLKTALAGKTIVIFGGSSGIGAAMAALARAAGADVHVFSRSTTGTDVGRSEDIASARRQVVERAGAIDFVVNSVGVLQVANLVDVDDDEIRKSTKVNYLAPVYIAREFFRDLSASHGSLLFFASSAYTRGRGGCALYTSAKAAVVNLTQALAEEWAGEARINCVSPQRSATRMRSAAFGDEPPESLLDPGEVARRSLGVLIGSGTGHVVDIRVDGEVLTPPDRLST